MKGDNDTWLDHGVKRDRWRSRLFKNLERPTDSLFISVRISTKTRYNTGLFILDLKKAPWGCGETSRLIVFWPGLRFLKGTWPAFWTLGEGTWPYVSQWAGRLYDSLVHVYVVIGRWNWYHRRCTRQPTQPSSLAHLAWCVAFAPSLLLSRYWGRKRIQGVVSPRTAPFRVHLW